MKPFMITLTFMLFLTIANAGTEGGNGGDWVASEFKERTQQVMTLLKKPNGNIHHLNLDALQAFVDRLDIHVTGDVLFDKNNKEVDALNFFPLSPKIILNRKKWMSYFLNHFKTNALVCHELLAITEGSYYSGSYYDDSKYQYSSEFSLSMVRSTSETSSLTLAENVSFFIGVPHQILRSAKLRNELLSDIRGLFCFRAGQLSEKLSLLNSALATEIQALPDPASPFASLKKSSLAEIQTLSRELSSLCELEKEIWGETLTTNEPTLPTLDKALTLFSHLENWLLTNNHP